MKDEESINVEKKRFEEAMKDVHDPVTLVLRGHLFTETLLERIISLHLARGDRILENGGLSYIQKLRLVDSFDLLGDGVVTSLQHLNKIRNNCAHELGRVITEADVLRVGRPIGSTFTKMYVSVGKEFELALHKLISYIIGYLTGYVSSMEEKVQK